jgi:hypothetical protein
MEREFSTENVRRMIEPIAQGFRADGFELHVLSTSPELSIRIEPQERACSDCLAPPSVIAGILSRTLGGLYAADEIRLAFGDEPSPGPVA